MRLGVALVALVLLGLLAYGGWRLVAAEVARARRAGALRARWHVRTLVEGSTTVVAVRRETASGEPVEAPHVVARLAGSDPDFDARYAEAVATAEMRAAGFNAGLPR